ncbi:hypothetical protein [Streptobacillus moniliformis]|uniref:hypothetical protein n=1 Tax=Streptobacillus moniliformis TaxID=34105 RepID=UPI0007E34670|nr:hypothetical protein [Streptobacillus moniliformis]
MKISLISDNKYINGRVNYYVKGESSEKIDIDKIDTEKPLKNKVIDYNFSVNPIPDSKVSISFDLYGQDKNFDYGPTIRYANGNIYSDVSVLFNNSKSSYDINNELDKIKHTAPGYDKVEYFKRWTLKEYFKDTDSFIEASKYDGDSVNLSNAEVSGKKGTIRILGYHSGSLYGDSLIRYVAKSVFDEIHANPYFDEISDIIKSFENDRRPFVADFILNALRYKKVMYELENKNQINNIMKKIVKNIYRKSGIGIDRKYSSVGIWSQTPEDFRYLLPEFYDYFDYSKINFDDLNPDYLYTGIKRVQIPKAEARASIQPQFRSSALPNPQDQDYFELVEKFHTFDNDIRDYLISGLYRELELEKIKSISKLGAWDFIKDTFVGSPISLTVHGELKLIQKAIKDPYEIKSLDILRGLYLHQSEKGKNVLEYEENLKEYFSDVDLNDNIAKYTPKIRINLGYINRNNKLGISVLLNDSVNVDSKKYSYTKKSHNLTIDSMYKKGVLDLSSKIKLEFSENDLSKKDNKLKYVYDTISLNTDTYFGFNIPATKKLNLLLGLRHIGQYGWINPKSAMKDGKEITWNIAKRYEYYNPIGKDDKTIIVSETTEKNLVDKEYERIKKDNKKEKLKRDIHQSDYIKTVESKSVKALYEMYNIISPRLTVIYRTYENIIFSSHLELPVGFRNFSPAGIKGMYSGEIKYLIDDSYKDMLFTTKNPIKFKSSGYVEGGAILGNEPGYYFSYKAMADISFLRGDIKGNDKNIDFNFSLNPLMVNLPIKPRLIISKDDTDISTRFGLEYSKGTESSTIVGFKYIFKSKKNIIEDELKPNILKILSYRNDNEYNKVKAALSDISFNDKLEYIITPFVDIKKEEGNFRLNIKADSIKIMNVVEKKEINSEVKTKNNYFAWSYQDYAWYSFNNSYNYFGDVKKEEKTVNKNETKSLEHEKYDIDIEAEYGQEKGINFNLNIALGYNETKLKDIKEEIKRVETKSKVISIESAKKSINDTDIQNGIGNEVAINEKSLLASLEAFSKYKGAKYHDIYITHKNPFATSYRKITEIELREILAIPYKIEESRIVEENIFLHARRININLDTYLGYSLNPTENINVSLGMRYKLNGRYESTNKIILKNIKLYGSRHFSFDSAIIPEIKMTYKLIHNLKARISAELPMYFKNKDFKEVKFNIKTGLEYKW